MPRWLTRTCTRVRKLVATGEFLFTQKASAEIKALGLFLSRADAAEVLTMLTRKDFRQRVQAHDLGEWLYVFTPQVGDRTLYIKLALRSRCIMVSFHDAKDEEPGA